MIFAFVVPTEVPKVFGRRTDALAYVRSHWQTTGKVLIYDILSDVSDPVGELDDEGNMVLYKTEGEHVHTWAFAVTAGLGYEYCSDCLKLRGPKDYHTNTFGSEWDPTIEEVEEPCECVTGHKQGYAVCLCEQHGCTYIFGCKLKGRR